MCKFECRIWNTNRFCSSMYCLIIVTMPVQRQLNHFIRIDDANVNKKKNFFLVKCFLVYCARACALACAHRSSVSNCLHMEFMKHSNSKSLLKSGLRHTMFASVKHCTISLNQNNDFIRCAPNKRYTSDLKTRLAICLH